MPKTNIDPRAFSGDMRTAVEDYLQSRKRLESDPAFWQRRREAAEADRRENRPYMLASLGFCAIIAFGLNHYLGALVTPLAAISAWLFSSALAIGVWWGPK